VGQPRKASISGIRDISDTTIRRQAGAAIIAAAASGVSGYA